VKPLNELDAPIARRLTGLLFDLDDTLLDHGKLSEAAYTALFRLRETGLRLVGVTGRPAGWGDVLVRQWPVDGMITENGAIGFRMDANGIRLVDSIPAGDREDRRARLRHLAASVTSTFPELEPADDVGARISDYTFDIGEHRRVEASIVGEARAFAELRGAVTAISSVHMHITFDRHDKATGTLRFLRNEFDVDPVQARR
jgi:hypothetical protein